MKFFCLIKSKFNLLHKLLRGLFWGSLINFNRVYRTFISYLLYNLIILKVYQDVYKNMYITLYIKGIATLLIDHDDLLCFIYNVMFI